jgi:hypothetical protein
MTSLKLSAETRFGWLLHFMDRSDPDGKIQ